MSIEIINNILVNPLEDFSVCNQFNYDYLIEQWKSYLNSGIKQLKYFLESILDEFHGSCVEYIPYWDNSFLPFFIIRISRSIPYKIAKTYWDVIYDKMEDYSISHGIIPSFNKINFTIDYETIPRNFLR
ncbi:MAG: hypothetical protein Q4P18_02300 [Methanobrevibacter sp.]|uniref:hypothetical protein n=1 Tax=Methanobrevibacter sp. TaxID=66852 RepID=UPI0026E05709|nr:hypothetical protein [Methanobrevibacter sp.]MDO5848342.1 hypothetical protein [Methanobrevibacter sp.]